MENELELYHHGIKGQRWGVRRFQNYDGTYTKKGLARYDKAASKYEDSKKRVVAAKKNFERSANSSTKALKAMDELNAAKRASKEAKREMKKSYKQLKNDYRADKGKEVYSSGETITGLQQKRMVATGASILAGYATSALYHNGTISPRVAATINIGNNAAWGAYMVKTSKDAKNLRAYYAH